jgi:hypothetical protein
MRARQMEVAKNAKSSLMSMPPSATSQREWRRRRTNWSYLAKT